MKITHPGFLVFATLTLVVSSLAGCSSPRDTTNPQIKAINLIREQLGLPELPLTAVGDAVMSNSPGGDLKVAHFVDSEKREFFVEPKTNQVVEIDARAILTSIPPDAPSLSQDELRAKVNDFLTKFSPNFGEIQKTLSYEEGGKIDNYFFTWYSVSSSASMNRPFLQLAYHKSGALFAYYNTLFLK